VCHIISIKSLLCVDLWDLDRKSKTGASGEHEEVKSDRLLPATDLNSLGCDLLNLCMCHHEALRQYSGVWDENGRRKGGVSHSPEGCEGEQEVIFLFQDHHVEVLVEPFGSHEAPEASTNDHDGGFR